jgi:hypothetical protein
VTVLRDLAFVLAQVGTPRPESLDVHLLHEPRDWWRDLITPGGGRMNRRTLIDVEKDREAREERLDNAREEREKASELDRERRALEVEKRRAIGALRVVRMATVESMAVNIASIRARSPWGAEWGRASAYVAARG